MVDMRLVNSPELESLTLHRLTIDYLFHNP